MKDSKINGTDIEIWNFIYLYKLWHNGNSPTLREIIEETSAKSTSHVRWILKKLQRGSYLNYYGTRQIEMDALSVIEDLDFPEPVFGEEIE